MNQNYKLTLYAVQVYGVRLSDYHEPRPVEILCNSEEERNTISGKRSRIPGSVPLGTMV